MAVFGAPRVADPPKGAELVYPSFYMPSGNSLSTPQAALTTETTSVIKDVPLPPNDEFRQQAPMVFVDQYHRASYYFNHCSIFATSMIRLSQETTREGWEWVPNFQSKCPKCGTEYERSVRKCTSCGYEGDMIEPTEEEKKLFVNWEGGSLIDKVNKFGWTLMDLVSSVLQITLVYNQPVILCKSIYFTDKHGSVVKEIPQEFLPLSPTKARMVYDEDTGAPGNGMGFCLADRSQAVNLRDPEVLRTGYYKGQRPYAARWCITRADSGNDDGGMYYAESEIFHKNYGVMSQNYGTPLCLLVEQDMRAWIALEARVGKFLEVGHPPGVFVVTNATEDSIATIQQSVRVQMQGDPFTVPIIGTPPTEGGSNSKWHPFADVVLNDYLPTKQELLQRITSVWGVIGLFAGDTSSLKGNTNEGKQIDVMDRTLKHLRGFVNEFLHWMISKCGIKTWTLRLKAPPDNQRNDEADFIAKQILNAKGYKELGFDILSQKDGIIEISSKPKAFDPLNTLFGEGGAEEQGLTNDLGLKDLAVSPKNPTTGKRDISGADALSKSVYSSDPVQKVVS